MTEIYNEDVLPDDQAEPLVEEKEPLGAENNPLGDESESEFTPGLEDDPMETEDGDEPSEPETIKPVLFVEMDAGALETGSGPVEETEPLEGPEFIPESESPEPLPWENAPEGVIYYNKIYEDNHLGSYTESPEMAYKSGWFENRISKDDVKLSDINGFLFLKDQCPMKSNEAKLQEAKEKKHQELRNKREQLRYSEFAHYDDDDFQIRPEDQDNINTFYSSALAMKLGAIESSGFGLMSETNTLHYFTADQIIELMAVMKAKVEEIYQRYWYARDVLLENAETIEEVESIEIPDTL